MLQIVILNEFQLKESQQFEYKTDALEIAVSN
jgi:hypothetical protein